MHDARHPLTIMGTMYAKAQAGGMGRGVGWGAWALTLVLALALLAIFLFVPALLGAAQRTPCTSSLQPSLCRPTPSTRPGTTGTPSAARLWSALLLLHAPPPWVGGIRAGSARYPLNGLINSRVLLCAGHSAVVSRATFDWHPHLWVGGGITHPGKVGDVPNTPLERVGYEPNAPER